MPVRALLTIIALLLINSLFAQNDELEIERYEVINALFAKADQVTLDSNYFPFLGISAIISDNQFIDNLLGHCLDVEKEATYSFAKIISSQEIQEMNYQISFYSYYKALAQSRLSQNIKLVKDKSNTARAISLPLISNGKAIVYMTNKDNEETLFVLVKKDGSWIVRCLKHLYQRIDD